MAVPHTRTILVSMVVLALAACSPSPSASRSLAPSASTSATVATPTPTTQRVKAPAKLTTAGRLTFLSDTTYPPQESIDPTSNRAVGFDIDIADAIAGRMGLTATIVTTDYAVLIPSLLARKGDAIISAMGVTPELQRQVSFVGYVQSGQSILVRKGNPAAIEKLSDLCGRPVGVQATTTEWDTLTSANAGDCAQRHIDIKIFPTDTAAVQALRDASLDAVIDDAAVAASFKTGNPDTLEVVGSPLHVGTEGIAVDPKNTEMVAAIQQAMLGIYGDGTYRTILARWNLEREEIPASQIIVTGTPSASP